MTDTAPSATDADESLPTEDRYASFTTDGEYVLYDRRESTAWLQSDTTYTLTEMV